MALGQRAFCGFSLVANVKRKFWFKIFLLLLALGAVNYGLEYGLRMHNAPVASLEKVAPDWLDCTADGQCVFKYDHLADEETDPFPVREKSSYPKAQKMRRAEIRAVKRWPDARACLIRSERKLERPDIAMMDWSRMRRSDDIEVCLFRIAASIGAPDGVAEWFRAQGFQRVIIAESSSRPIVIHGGKGFDIHGGNSFSTGKSYRTRPLLQGYLFTSLSNGESFSVSMLSNGKAIGSSYWDNNFK